MRKAWTVVVGLFAVSAPLVLAGCIGPAPERSHVLVESYWKHRRERPVVIESQFRYYGEPPLEVFREEDLEGEG